MDLQDITVVIRRNCNKIQVLIQNIQPVVLYQNLFLYKNFIYCASIQTSWGYFYFTAKTSKLYKKLAHVWITDVNLVCSLIFDRTVSISMLIYQTFIIFFSFCLWFNVINFVSFLMKVLRWPFCFEICFFDGSTCRKHLRLGEVITRLWSPLYRF